MVRFVRFALILAVAATAAASGQTLSIVSGDGQIVLEQFRATSPMVVQAKDAAGNPLAGVAIQWAAPPGTGQIVGASGTTGADGKAQAYFSAGSNLGAGGLYSHFSTH